MNRSARHAAFLSTTFLVAGLLISCSTGDEEVTEESTSAQTPVVSEPTSEMASVPPGHQEAVDLAESYLKSSEFSESGLYGQLLYEGFSEEEAQHGVSMVEVDWDEQALQSAARLLDSSSYSQSRLYDRLIFEEYTPDQAQDAVDSVNADWLGEAAESAEGYMSSSALSESDLYDQLIYEGFTPEQAQHGVASVM